MKKILLCSPTFYDIEYEINPWMHIENKVDKKKVMDEYRQLRAAYKSLGASVLEINPVKGLPDMVYAANLGFPFGNKFALSNFRYPQRKEEAKYAREFFEKKGFEIVNFPDKIYFEGQGDLLTTGGKYFLGWGKRSSREAKDILSKMLKINLIDFELIDPYFYHLDMSLGPLNKETVLMKPESFTKEGIAKIKREFKNVIEVSKEDNKFMACNLVVVNKNVVIGQGISGKLKKSIEEYGFKVVEVPMDEYRKGGGSIKCLTLEFY
jgi:N-dimethylarginine dimethylaminohydrolase